MDSINHPKWEDDPEGMTEHVAVIMKGSVSRYNELFIIKITIKIFIHFLSLICIFLI